VPLQKEGVYGDANREPGLMSGKRQKNQNELAFMAETGSEAPTNDERAELLMAKREPESGDRTERLMEEVCEPENMRKALKRVQSNKGAPGIDGITVDELPGYLRRNWPRHREELLGGTYKPKPARRKEIPKPGGGVRNLSIPCVLDRLIQQAVLQVLQGRWDPTFSEHSYGFRPGRSQHQAVARAQEYIAAGNRTVVDIDLEKFLDASSYYTRSDGFGSKREGMVAGTLIRKPLRRPRCTWTACSSPRFTRCNTVCRETPRMWVASSIGRYPSGACSTKRERSSSVMRMRHGAPGVSCSAAMKPSFNQRWTVEGATPRISAALCILTNSPSGEVDDGAASKRGIPQ
jgi:hypothetical protein